MLRLVYILLLSIAFLVPSLQGKTPFIFLKIKTNGQPWYPMQKREEPLKWQAETRVPIRDRLI